MGGLVRCASEQVVTMSNRKLYYCSSKRNGKVQSVASWYVSIAARFGRMVHPLPKRRIAGVAHHGACCRYWYIGAYGTETARLTPSLLTLLRSPCGGWSVQTSPLRRPRDEPARGVALTAGEKLALPHAPVGPRCRTAMLVTSASGSLPFLCDRFFVGGGWCAPEPLSLSDRQHVTLRLVVLLFLFSNSNFAGVSLGPDPRTYSGCYSHPVGASTPGSRNRGRGWTSTPWTSIFRRLLPAFRPRMPRADSPAAAAAAAMTASLWRGEVAGTKANNNPTTKREGEGGEEEQVRQHGRDTQPR